MYASYAESSLWAGTILYKALCPKKMSRKNLKTDLGGLSIGAEEI